MKPPALFPTVFEGFWTGFDDKIGFSVKNDAEWWRYHADSSFQSRERARLYA